jgi:hypothetical protein
MEMVPVFLSVRKSYLFGMAVVSASVSGFLWAEGFGLASVLLLAPVLRLSRTATAGASALAKESRLAMTKVAVSVSGVASALAKESQLVTAKDAESASGAASALAKESRLVTAKVAESASDAASALAKRSRLATEKANFHEAEQKLKDEVEQKLKVTDNVSARHPVSV